jgi:hypothetical protein
MNCYFNYSFSYDIIEYLKKFQKWYFEPVVDPAVVAFDHLASVVHVALVKAILFSVPRKIVG